MTAIPMSAADTRAKIGRDGFGRPLIELKGKLVAYTRASTVCKVLEDEYFLTKWKLRKVAEGVAKSKGLQMMIIGHADDNETMDNCVEDAMEVAGAGERAQLGTAIHKICDLYDHGEHPEVPEEYANDVAEYLRLTACFVVEASELFCVSDEHKIAGTPDRILRLTKDMVVSNGDILPAGTLVIADIKTGSTLDFSQLSIGGQLAVYSRSQRYDLSGGRTMMHKGQELPVGDRVDWVPGERINTAWGLVIHLPAGEGSGSLHWVDLTKGWQMAARAMELRQVRKTKDIIGGPILPPVEDYFESAKRASSLTSLATVYQRAVAANAWCPELRAVFTARRIELEGAVA